MAKLKLAAALLLLPITCVAEAYLCIPEVAATVNDESGKNLEGGSVDAAKVWKFILIKVGERWEVRRHGDDAALFDYCSPGFVCEATAGWGGTFIKDDSNFFQVVYTASNDAGTSSSLVVAKGKCSKI